MTVSRVLNHPDQVSQELRELVDCAIKKLNYQPNVAAKALAENRTRVVKFFNLEKDDTVEPYYAMLLNGIAQSLDDFQYALQIVSPNSLNVGRCDGYIVTGLRREFYSWLDDLTHPVILFGENHLGFDYVDTDNKQGTAEATNYAIAKNYQSIIFIGIDLKEPFEISREVGYSNTMRCYNKRARIIRLPNHSHVSEHYLVEHWHEFSPNTCFICASDRLALGIERGLQRCGARIPLDFGIIGFDGVFLDQIASPKLTTVKQHVTLMGHECGRLLLKKIDQDNAPQGQLELPPELIVRETTRS